jgi:hypothetical protein
MKINIYQFAGQVESNDIEAAVLRLTKEAERSGHLFLIDADDLTDCDAPQDAVFVKVTVVKVEVPGSSDHTAISVEQGVMPR